MPPSPKIPRAPTYQGFSVCNVLSHLFLTAPFTEEETGSEAFSALPEVTWL